MRILLTTLFLGLAACLSAQHSVSFLKIPARPLGLETISTGNNNTLYPFELVRGMVYVEAQLNGQVGQYILDTGAPYVVVNAKPQGNEDSAKAHSIAQPVDVAYSSAKSFDFAGHSKRNITLLQLDISHIERAAKRNLAGLIGYEEFKDGELYLNYPGRQMGVLQAGHNRLHRTSKPLYSIPFRLEGHLPVIDIRVGAQVLRLGIDTGAGANILDPLSASMIDAAFITSLPSEQVQGLDQQINEVSSITLHGLRVQETALGSSSFLLSDLSALRQNSDIQLDGLLGYTFLQSYKLSIDYVQGLLHIWAVE